MNYLLLLVYSVVVIVITYSATIKISRSNESVVVKEVVKSEKRSSMSGNYTSATGKVSLSYELQDLLELGNDCLNLDEIFDMFDLKTVTVVKENVISAVLDLPFRQRMKARLSKTKFKWLEVEFRVLQNGLEKQVSFEVKDISDVIELESKVWVMESTIKSIVDNTMLVSFFAFDSEGRLILYNDRFQQKVENLFNYKISKGIKPLDILDQKMKENESLSDLYVSAQRYFNSKASDKKFQAVEKVTFSEDCVLYYECEYSPITVTSGKTIGGIVFVRDVTVDVHMKEELIKERQYEKNANEAKSKFLSNMGHEIRTPLNGVIGMTNLLLDTKLDSKQLYMLNIVKESGEFLLSVINDILDFSKIEAGEIALVEEVVNLKDMLTQIEEMFNFKAEENRIHFSASVSNAVPEYVLMDSLRLKQILINLVGNAFKFTEKGHIRLMIDIVDYNLMFSVEDTGIGIPDDKLEHIFDSFKQVSDDTTKKYGGTGLGLTISKELVELMGGRIKVSSRVSVGTVFYFTLPISIPGDDEMYIFKQSNDPEVSLLEGSKVLIAEDNKINQILMKEVLSKYHCDFKIVSNGFEAIEAVSKSKFDCILMDVSMPEMDGIQATKFLRKTYDQEALPIIAVTAHATMEYKDTLIEAGMNDFISKPVDTRLLIQTLGKYCKIVTKSWEIMDHRSSQQEGDAFNQIIKKVAQFNFDYIESQLMGNKTLVPEVGQRAVKLLSNELIPEVEKHNRLGTLEACLKLTHKAKGAISNFGETDLLACIKQLDEAIRYDSLDDVHSIIETLKLETSKFEEAVKTYNVM